MKIATATVRPVRLRFAQPLGTALGEFHERDVVLLELRDVDGVPGWGEAAPWPGFAVETPADSLAALQTVATRIAGAEVEPDDQRGLAHELLQDRPAARCALDGALRDLAARRNGRPLRDELAAAGARLVAGPALPRVMASALLVAQAPGAVHEEAARVRDAGFRAAKLKLGGRPLALDLARLRAARVGLGPGIALRGDANAAWTVEEALAALAAIAEFDLEYVEQPVGARDLEGFARLRGRTPMRIAADESVASETDALNLVEGGLVDVVVLKPAVLGGSLRALGIAARARRAGIDVVFTHAMESAVGARHALHCAAAWGDEGSVHGLVTEGLFVQDVATAVAAETGRVSIPREPGLGIQP